MKLDVGISNELALMQCQHKMTQELTACVQFDCGYSELVLQQRGNFSVVINMFVCLSNATTCPCGLRCPPSWAWQQCNRLLRLGRP